MLTSDLEEFINRQIGHYYEEGQRWALRYSIGVEVRGGKKTTEIDLKQNEGRWLKSESYERLSGLSVEKIEVGKKKMSKHYDPYGMERYILENT